MGAFFIREIHGSYTNVMGLPLCEVVDVLKGVGVIDLTEERMESTVAANIARVRNAIADAASRSGREASDVRLMAVTKTVDDDRIMEAIAAGVDMIGESYVQEAKRKIEKMGRRLEWHMIGYLQSNKAKYAVRLFDMIHSVDRIDLSP